MRPSLVPGSVGGENVYRESHCETHQLNAIKKKKKKFMTLTV